MKTTLKYPGSKWSYADWIISFFPEHDFYVEPFFGSGAVFFKKQPSVYETINDVDGLVVNFFKVIRDKPEKLARAINLTPFARDEYRDIQENHAGEEIHLTGDDVEDARRFAVRCSQGFGSKLADRVGWKNTKKNSGPINPKIWSRIPDTVFLQAQRLKNAQIENTDAIELIKDCNHASTLIYADPPYLLETRGSRIYRHEFETEEKHAQLLETLKKHKGYVILSGYENDLYNTTLKGWHKEKKEGRANSAAVREEILWMNFEAQTTLWT